MTTVLPVASGKGGVGKSLLCANLGITLAREGKTVLLVDLDLGGSNLHTCLGVSGSSQGIGHFIHRRVERLDQLVIDTGRPKLFMIPGDSLLPATANLPYFRKVKLLRELQELVADYIILDLGAGSSFNTVDFFLAAAGGVLVCTPETTSILNAYSFLKSVCYRMLYRSFPPKSTERKVIHEFMTERIEGTDRSLASLVEQLAECSAESGTTASRAIGTLVPRIVLNMGKQSRDTVIGRRLREISRRNLGVEVEYIGFLPADELLGRSVISRTPVVESHPQCIYAQGMRTIARKLIATPVPSSPHFYEDDEDLMSLGEMITE